MKNVVLAGGITNCSLFPRVFPALSEKNAESPIWIPSHPPCPEAPHDNMVVTVGENTAKKYNISREDQDKWAFRSHQLAHECIRQGLYADEIVPVKRPGESPFMIDEQPQLFKSLDDLAKLDPIMGPGNTITMGNAAGLNDGASMVGMCSSSHAREHNIEPLAVIHGWATAGVEPKDTGGAPAIVVPKALEAASLSINDIDVFEINDPFAVLGVAFSRALDIDEAYINVHGSAVALGHPVACSGARMITTLIHALRKRGGGYGLAVICGAGGMASAVVVEVLKPS
jgi:acetyl-CoA acetyltransferase family protein